ECPYGIAVCTQHPLVAAGRNHDILLSVNLVDRRWRVGPKPSLETPQFLTGLGIESEEIAVGFAAEDETAGRRRRASSSTGGVGRLALPDDLVGVAAD